jgi:hypothetical protein
MNRKSAILLSHPSCHSVELPPSDLAGVGTSCNALGCRALQFGTEKLRLVASAEICVGHSIRIEYTS